MNLRPDFDRTVTGYRWLDTLTRPFWEIRMKWTEYRLYKMLGDGDTERGKAILQEAFRQSDLYQP